MTWWMIVFSIFAVAVVLPVVASFVMATILESANNEGLYDDEE